MEKSYIPYGAYWATPFARWQGSFAGLHALEFAAADGYEIVPKPEAKQLAAYLLTLKANAPLYEAPFTPLTTAK